MARTVWTILEHYPPQTVSVLMNSLSTHDIPRAITALAGEPFAGQDREWPGPRDIFCRRTAIRTEKRNCVWPVCCNIFCQVCPAYIMGTKPVFPAIGTRFNRLPLIQGTGRSRIAGLVPAAGYAAPGIFFPSGERGLSSGAVEPGFVLLRTPTRQPYAAGRCQPGRRAVPSLAASGPSGFCWGGQTAGSWRPKRGLSCCTKAENGWEEKFCGLLYHTDIWSSTTNRSNGG